MQHESRHRGSSSTATDSRAVEPGLPGRPGGTSRSAFAYAGAPPSPVVQRKEEAAGPGKKAGTDPGTKAGAEPGKKAGTDEIPKLAETGIAGPATSLPYQERIQRAFGRHDVSGIQAHIGGPAAQACKQIGARAFAMGNHVAFREAPDLHTAAHEAAHVVQQRAGVHVTDGVGAAGDDYERSADAAADAVVAGGSAEALLGPKADGQPSGDHGGGPDAGASKPAGEHAAGSGAGAGKQPGDQGAAKPAAAGSVQRKADAAGQEAACPTCQGDACQCDGNAKTDGAPARAPAASKAVQRLVDDAPVQMKAEDAVQMQEPPAGDHDAAADGGGGWTPPAGCPTNFCQPYSSPILAALDKQARWPFLRAGIAVKVGLKAAVLWDLWANGGTGVLDMSGLFGGDFTGSPTTAATATFLNSAIRTAVIARTALAPGQTATVSVASLIPTEVAAINISGGPNEMNFNVISDLAGNIAGGIGADQAANPIGATPSPQNDARLVNGNVTIVGLPNGDQQVTPAYTFTVKDTIDLCPGNCGASTEQVATVPMSQWEASGVAGDVPYTVTFAPPATSLAAFTVHPSHPVATAPPGTPATPAPPGATPTPAPGGGNQRT